MNLPKASRMPSSSGREPPDSEVPPPRGTTLTFISFASAMIAATCGTVSGSTTTIGNWRYIVTASHS